jgi:hypothetical protein
MLEFLSQPAFRAALGIAVLLAGVYAGYQVVIWLRPTTSKPDTSVDALARNLEEMRLGGDIDEAEHRKIKAVLGKHHGLRTGGQSADGSQLNDCAG